MPLFGGSKTPRGTSTPRSQPAGEFLGDGSFVCALGSLTVNEVALARVNFKKFDSDGDGIISRADFGAAMCKHDASWLNESKASQLDQMYAAVDLDGTGAVTFDKFAVMRVRKKLSAAERQAAQGYAAQQEAQQMPSLTPRGGQGRGPGGQGQGAGGQPRDVDAIEGQEGGLSTVTT